jgi:hypothetical protein
MTVKWADSPSDAESWVQVSWVGVGTNDGHWHVTVSGMPGAVVYDAPGEALRTAEFFAQRHKIDHGVWSAPSALREAMRRLTAPRQAQVPAEV